MGLRCDAPQASGLRNATSSDAQFGKRVASLMDTSHYAFASRWAHRVAESYRRSTHLTPAEQTAFEAHLRDPLIHASISATPGLHLARHYLNPAIGRWEATNGRSGPRVASIDLSAGEVTMAQRNPHSAP